MDTPLEPLTASQEEEVLGEIGYSRAELTRDLASLKVWLSTQDHFPPSAFQEPDAFFSNFIIGCKGNMERVKGKIDNYYRFRSRAKEFFSNRDPLDTDSSATWPYFQLLTLPKSTPDGSRVLMTLSGITDYPNYNPYVIVKRILSIIEMRLRSEPMHGGEYLVMDNNNYSTSYFIQAFRPTFARAVVDFIQNVLPWRIKGIISLNTPYFLNVAINRVLKNLIKSKIAKRWYVYTEGPEILSKHFPLDILPKDYGGGNSALLQEISDRWMEHASNSHWREWFVTQGSEMSCTDEDDGNGRGMFSFRNFWG